MKELVLLRQLPLALRLVVDEEHSVFGNELPVGVVVGEIEKNECPLGAQYAEHVGGQAERQGQ